MTRKGRKYRRLRRRVRRAPVRTGVTIQRALRAATRIRSKLIFLHTCFSIALAVTLLLVLRAPIQDIVRNAEHRRCAVAARAYAAAPSLAPVLEREGFALERGSAGDLGIGDETVRAARQSPGEPVEFLLPGGRPGEVIALPDGGFVLASTDEAAHREAVNRLYLILTLALLAVYGLIALTLEVFVLPGQVYLPIDRLLRADRAVQEGRREEELIREPDIPSDELGEIMRSRNASILKLREQERELARVLDEVEEVAAELKRKNYLLETAQRNLADQDRLASLGMMSAGIAHELNTPLAVLKGCVERLVESGGEVDPERAALMLRVVNRLEGLSESLLDFARARSGSMRPVRVRPIIEEAWTLVSIDREARDVRFANEVAEDAVALGDDDRLTQVFVNLIRNAVDAVEGSGRIAVSSERVEREQGEWLGVTVRDDGPGIDPRVMARLFEPFASTRLDSRGTGLGLAVAEGIVKEHGGVILARNESHWPDGSEGGAAFEVLLPSGRVVGADQVCEGEGHE